MDAPKVIRPCAEARMGPRQPLVIAAVSMTSCHIPFSFLSPEKTKNGGPAAQHLHDKTSCGLPSCKTSGCPVSLQSELFSPIYLHHSAILDDDGDGPVFCLLHQFLHPLEIRDILASGRLFVWFPFVCHIDSPIRNKKKQAPKFHCGDWHLRIDTVKSQVRRHMQQHIILFSLLPIILMCLTSFS